MDRADGFVVIDRGINAPLWEEVARGMWDGKPQFLVKPPRYVTAEVADFVKAKTLRAFGSVERAGGSTRRRHRRAGFRRAPPAARWCGGSRGLRVCAESLSSPRQ